MTGIPAFFALTIISIFAVALILLVVEMLGERLKQKRIIVLAAQAAGEPEGVTVEAGLSAAVSYGVAPGEEFGLVFAEAAQDSVCQTSVALAYFAYQFNTLIDDHVGFGAFKEELIGGKG